MPRNLPVMSCGCLMERCDGKRMSHSCRFVLRDCTSSRHAWLRCGAQTLRVGSTRASSDRTEPPSAIQRSDEDPLAARALSNQMEQLCGSLIGRSTADDGLAASPTAPIASQPQGKPDTPMRHAQARTAARSWQNATRSPKSASFFLPRGQHEHDDHIERGHSAPHVSATYPSAAFGEAAVAADPTPLLPLQMRRRAARAERDAARFRPGCRRRCRNHRRVVAAGGARRPPRTTARLRGGATRRPRNRIRTRTPIRARGRPGA